MKVKLEGPKLKIDGSLIETEWLKLEIDDHLIEKSGLEDIEALAKIMMLQLRGVLRNPFLCKFWTLGQGLLSNDLQSKILERREELLNAKLAKKN